MPNKNVERRVHKGVVMRSNDIDNITVRHNNTHHITPPQGRRPTTTNVFCSELFFFSLQNIFIFYKIFCLSGKVFASQQSCGGYHLIDVVLLGCILFNSPDSVKIIPDIKTLSL